MMQHYGYGRTVEEAMANLFRGAPCRKMSECDRMWINMMRYRDALDVVEREILRLKRSISSARAARRNQTGAAASAIIVLLSGAIGSLVSLIRALRVLRKVLQGQRFSRQDLKTVLSALGPIAAAAGAAYAAAQAMSAHADLHNLQRDMERIAETASRLEGRIRDAATQIDSNCASDRYIG